MKCYDYNCIAYEKRQGIWRGDIFIDGSFYSAILNCEEGNYVLVTDDDEQPLSRDYHYIRDMFCNKGLNYCRSYYFANMTLKDGGYGIIEGTMKPICFRLGGSLDCFCYECELL
jgi:hypothetical protein